MGKAEFPFGIWVQTSALGWCPSGVVLRTQATLISVGGALCTVDVTFQAVVFTKFSHQRPWGLWCEESYRGVCWLKEGEGKCTQAQVRREGHRLQDRGESLPGEAA